MAMAPGTLRQLVWGGSVQPGAGGQEDQGPVVGSCSCSCFCSEGGLEGARGGAPGGRLGAQGAAQGLGGQAGGVGPPPAAKGHGTW
jgi:hypothetical protein